MRTKRLAATGALALAAALWCLLAVTMVRASDQGSALYGGWQILDLDDLAREPFRTLWLSHAFPPLFNAVIALLLRLRIDPYTGLVIINAGCALLTAGIVFTLTRRCTGQRGVAIATAVGYAFSPSTFFFLAQPLYGSMTAALVAVLVLAFVEVDDRPARSLAVFALALIGLTYLRAFFTWGHVMLFCGVFALRAWRSRTPALVPVLLLTCVAGLALPVKNLLIHGFFGSSSQAVFSLLKGVGLTTEPDLGGSPDALQIRAALPGLTCSGSTRFQDREPLKANGHANFNACEVQTFGALQWRHLRADYRLRPHWRRVRAHAGMYLSSATSAAALADIGPLSVPLRIDLAAYDRLFVTRSVRPGMDMRLLWPVALIAGAVLAVRRRSPSLIFMLVVIGVHALTHILSDGNEANRFVFDIEALWFVLAAVPAASLWTAAAGLVARRPASPAVPARG